MGVDLLLGLQWGDEGKGKIVDVLTKNYDIIARFQGGPNAGHTLIFDGHKHVLHTIPSGIFHKTALNVVGNGVVIDPVIFEKEIEKLKPFNIDFSKAVNVSDLIQKNEIKNFNELISFFKQNNYSYNNNLKWHDFSFGRHQTSRSIALEKNGDIFFMADLFVFEDEQEIISWSDLQWLPGS